MKLCLNERFGEISRGFLEWRLDSRVARLLLPQYLSITQKAGPPESCPVFSAT
jgi:hypothetical protein